MQLEEFEDTCRPRTPLIVAPRRATSCDLRVAIATYCRDRGGNWRLASSSSGPSTAKHGRVAPAAHPPFFAPQSIPTSPLNVASIMTYCPSAALAVRLARRTTNSNPLWWSTAAAPPPPTPAPCAATTAATAHLRHAASVSVVARVGAPSFAPFCVAPRPGPRGGGRGAPRGTVVPPTRSARSSSSTVGADADGTAGGPPSEAQVTAALNDINERFSEARLLLGEARDALGSVYFGACAGGYPFGGRCAFGRRPATLGHLVWRWAVGYCRLLPCVCARVPL